MIYIAIILYILGIRMHYVMGRNLVNVIAKDKRFTTLEMLFASLFWPIAALYYGIINNEK